MKYIVILILMSCSFDNPEDLAREAIKLNKLKEHCNKARILLNLKYSTLDYYNGGYACWANNGGSEEIKSISGKPNDDYRAFFREEELINFLGSV